MPGSQKLQPGISKVIARHTHVTVKEFEAPKRDSGKAKQVPTSWPGCGPSLRGLSVCDVFPAPDVSFPPGIDAPSAQSAAGDSGGWSPELRVTEEEKGMRKNLG